MAFSSTETTEPTTRISFAKLAEPLQPPSLLSLQTQSFDWLLGNRNWQQRVVEAREDGQANVPDISGLEEVFQEISPVTDPSETMQLSFSNPTLEDPTNDPEKCRQNGLTYSAKM